MKIFITSTNTDIGKTYITIHLYHLLKMEGYNVCIFKPLQTEELDDGTYPDLEIYKRECHLDYQVTSLYKFKDPISPHLAFKRKTDQKFDKTKILSKLNVLEHQFDVILIEGAGGIAVPIHENENSFYMTADLIRDTADMVLSVLPSQLGAISDAIVHQHFLTHMHLPFNILIMNQYTDSSVEQDNKHTIEKLTQKDVYTFSKNANYNDFSKTFITTLKGAINHE